MRVQEFERASWIAREIESSRVPSSRPSLYARAAASILLLALGALSSSAACSLPSRDEFAGGQTSADSGALDASDASVSPAADGSRDDGGDASSSNDAGVENLLTAAEGGFEDGACDKFGGYNATTATSNDEHSGATSCMICRQGMGSYTLDIDVAPKPKVGETYHASAWVKAGPSGALGQQMALRLRSHTDTNPYVDIQVETTPNVPLTDTWTLLEVNFVLTTAGGDAIDVYVAAEGGSGQPRCFLVDDLAVWRAK